MKLHAVLEAKYGIDLEIDDLPHWVDVGMLKAKQHEKWVHQYIEFVRDNDFPLKELYDDIANDLGHCVPENPQQWDSCIASLDLNLEDYFGDYSELAGQAYEDILKDIVSGYDWN